MQAHAIYLTRYQAKMPHVTLNVETDNYFNFLPIGLYSPSNSLHTYDIIHITGKKVDFSFMNGLVESTLPASQHHFKLVQCYQERAKILNNFYGGHWMNWSITV